MIARITDIEDGTSYTVYGVAECRDATDASAYVELLRSDEKCVQMGKVCAERVKP